MNNDITASQLAECIGEVVVIDVREPYEWSAGHLEGSIHIPLAQLPARIDEIPRDREIVMLCRSGGRSAHAQHFLQQAGYEKVRNLAGGIIAWARECDPALKVV